VSTQQKDQPARPGKLALITGGRPRNRAVKSERRFARLPAVIWAERRRRGLSIVAMARELGVGPSRLSEWQSGHRLPRADRLARFAKFSCLTPEPIHFLRLAWRIDRVFQTGAPTIEALHERVIAIIEEEADLRPQGSR